MRCTIIVFSDKEAKISKMQFLPKSATQGVEN